MYLSTTTGIIFLDASPIIILYLLFFVSMIIVSAYREKILLKKAKKLELNRGYSNGGFYMQKYGNHGIALMHIFTTIVKADGKVYNAEIDFVRGYLYNRFINNKIDSKEIDQYEVQEGREHNIIINGMMLFDEIYKKPSDLDNACKWMAEHTLEADRKDLLWFLFRLSKVNRSINSNEVRILEDVSKQLNLSEEIFKSIKSEFIKEKKRKSFFSSYFASYSELDKAYKTLGVTSSNTNKEIKLAFRKLARQYHPDRFAQDSEEKKQWAEDKFSELSAAYDIIEKKRGIK